MRARVCVQDEKPLWSDYMLQGIPNLERTEQKRALRMHNKDRILKHNVENAKN